ncbi:hypothetical protein Salat_0119700 [Sesamum alatum]|uniref:Uncharacterized protein n=1 Tax=Sesamum alatum TaxID=300844 RepID=A0AAE1YXE0_9LAMI|nr:hypothetical protein Salat_0119700 [Sesamum alatum]
MEGNEDPKAALNQRNKGKKVLFINDQPTTENESVVNPAVATKNALVNEVNAETSLVSNILVDENVFTAHEGNARNICEQHVENAAVHVNVGKDVNVGNIVVHVNVDKAVNIDDDVNSDKVVNVSADVGYVIPEKNTNAGNVATDNAIGIDNRNDFEHGIFVVSNMAKPSNSVCHPSSFPELEDDFNYDDPLIAALLDKNWAEETDVRKNTSYIIADIEAVNEIMERSAYKTPEKEKKLIVTVRNENRTENRSTPSSANAGSIQKTTSEFYTRSLRLTQHLEKGSIVDMVKLGIVTCMIEMNLKKMNLPQHSIDSKALKILKTLKLLQNRTLKLRTLHTQPPPLVTRNLLHTKQAINPTVTSPLLILVKNMIKLWKQHPSCNT